MIKEYDCIVIGGGSGGVAFANEAARFGAKVALVEAGPMGGTCVNVGCVPKKIMWLAGHQAHLINHAHEWSFNALKADCDWGGLTAKRQAYIERLNSLYQNKLTSNDIDVYHAKGQVISSHRVNAGKFELKAKQIILATGGHPFIPDLPGKEFGITSDGFFALKKRPKRVVIIGAGYIAVELAGLLNSLGSEVHLVFRHKTFLRQFDGDLVDKLMEIYQQNGIHLHPRHQPIAVDETKPGVYCVNCEDQDKISNIDAVIWATGRTANTQGLFADDIIIDFDESGNIKVDKQQRTSINSIFAVGDLTGQMALTPVAIAQGRRLARHLYNQQSFDAIDYDKIATVIFSHPPIASCGMTEAQAHAKDIPIIVYRAQFNPMTQAFAKKPIPCIVKLVVCETTEKVLGCHVLGDGADELMQGFSVAVNMGATKKDFDRTIAIHPTLAEELVTLR